MNTLLRDIQHGLRTLRRHPLFAIVAVSTLALGIGANTAVFSVIDAVLLRPFPYPHSEELVVIRAATREYPSASVSLPDYLDWRAGQRSCTDLAFMRRQSFNLSSARSGTIPPERVAGATVSANFFPVVALKPALGRSFTDEEDAPGGPHAVILTDSLWRRRFGGDPAVVGRTLTLDGVSRQIVGILPPAERFRSTAEIYAPLGDMRADPVLLNRGVAAGFTALGRLKPGVTPAQVKLDLDNVAQELSRRYPETNTGSRVVVQYWLESAVGKYRHSLLMLLGAVGCVLLIACANVANLQLARTTGRAKELAVRAALGASRSRLVRQMLTESALVGIIGGMLGVLLALWAVDAIVALSPPEAMRFHDTRLDWRALGFTTFAALSAGLLAGLWPAWRISRTAVMAAALREGGGRSETGSGSQHRARSLLVVLQVALAVVLLTCAGLTLKSFWRMQSEPVGFNPSGILVASISLPEARYGTKDKQAPFYNTLLEKVRALPGVEAAAIGVNLPFDNNEWDTSFHLTAAPPNPPGSNPSAEMNFVTPDYFKVMGMPLVRGRVFDAHDTDGRERVTLIDETFARRYFAGQDPVGQQIDQEQAMDPQPLPTTIVGVVPRTRNVAPREDPVLESMPQIYLPLLQYTNRDASLVVRVAGGDPLRMAEPVRRAVLSLDDDLPVSEVATMEHNIAVSLGRQRMTMALLGVFSGLALVLASIGLYGVMALSVTQRTRELGIRLALGAQRAAVLGLIMRQGARLVGIGLAVGLAAALVLGRLLASVLYGIGGSDLLMLGGVTAVLASASLLACWLPALRATRVDPMNALRSE